MLQRIAAIRKPAGLGFDFTWHMRRLCSDLTDRLPELAHIDMTRVATRFCQARKPVRHGIQATLTPLRFAGGAPTHTRRGRTWSIRKLYNDSGQEMFYLLSFYLPRFLERSFPEKLTTVVHELWHISPAFDGDLRRHEGRCYAHGPRGKDYDAHVGGLAEKWLSLAPPVATYEFLKSNFRQLKARHGRVFGERIPTPRLIRN